MRPTGKSVANGDGPRRHRTKQMAFKSDGYTMGGGALRGSGGVPVRKGFTLFLKKPWTCICKYALIFYVLWRILCGGANRIGVDYIVFLGAGYVY